MHTNLQFVSSSWCRVGNSLFRTFNLSSFAQNCSDWRATVSNLITSLLKKEQLSDSLKKIAILLFHSQKMSHLHKKPKSKFSTLSRWHKGQMWRRHCSQSDAKDWWSKILHQHNKHRPFRNYFLLWSMQIHHFRIVGTLLYLKCVIDRHSAAKNNANQHFDRGLNNVKPVCSLSYIYCPFNYCLFCLLF